MFKEFKEFAVRGNVLDLAIGVIIGAAFGKIVTSLVDDVIMPPIGMLLGPGRLLEPLRQPDGTALRHLAQAKAAGAPTINYGLFLNAVITFLIVAFVVFLIVRAVNRMRRGEEAPTAPPVVKECQYCLSPIPIKATRCPHCTSQLAAA